jgi:hypothetical protein
MWSPSSRDTEPVMRELESMRRMVVMRRDPSGEREERRPGKRAVNQDISRSRLRTPRS